jgi:hypothetical protein
MWRNNSPLLGGTTPRSESLRCETLGLSNALNLDRHCIDGDPELIDARINRLNGASKLCHLVLPRAPPREGQDCGGDTESGADRDEREQESHSITCHGSLHREKRSA